MTKRPPITILNVDDHRDSLQVKSMILRHAGFQVKEASTGREALRLVATERPQLTLLDVNLPDIDGFEVCRQIKTDPATATIPVLHISAAYTDGQAQAHGLEVGADGYLAEPVDPAVLVATIKALLRVRQAEEAVRLSAHQWQATFDATRDGISLLDLDGRILRCNEALARLWDQPTEQVVGRLHDELLPLNYQVSGLELSPFYRMLATGQREVIDLPLGEHWFYLTADPVRDEAGTLTGAVLILSDITERKRAETEREQLIQELQAALSQVKFLSGLLPICSACKKIRDDKGYWNQIEVYISNHSQAEFSHGICPGCAQQLYPQFDLYKDELK